MVSRTVRRLIALGAALLGLSLASAASAATLYITEYPNIGSIQSQSTPWPPGAAIAAQTVAVGGASVQSSAFGSSTKAVSLFCDVGCSIQIGDNPTATTSLQVLQQGWTYNFVVVPGQKVAVIANSAGDTPGGGGTTTDVNVSEWGGTATTLGQKAMTASVPVVIASNQATFPVTATLAAGSALAGSVSIDQTTSGTTNAVVPVPIATATAGITSVSTSAVASNRVIKNSPGNLYGFSVTTGATAGFVFVSNTTTAPTAGGAAITPVKCYVIAANSTLGVTFNPPLVLSTGVTLVFSTTGCFTNTASSTAFISGDAK